ncbi:dynamin family protein [Leptolyngbya cf. ectocarpi LEGE 11479]|uniref:Dynamin family protein n=1 Tax=Leptolyngbya cf. ectocarpi LEGE 11479 TaxID=1828722 RepID=A0A928ZYT6_LEPEC|nr:dynamin family protein [Leptolyngbya ectocarpi]MBE9070007.1 dynamin family protein [Leptolyngbya cf. ectocarpi LEGE 11479]
MTATPPSIPSLDPVLKAVGLLNPDQAELKAKLLRQCVLFSHPTLRISVFGPFNYGKSTLLNALLGKKTLPIALVPTTGTVITINYGPQLTSRITLGDGTVLEEPGTQLLQQYAVLDRPQDIMAAEVQCPHPLLQAGVELVDLPGTDDQANNNQLVYTQLLETDVVIQLLDGRKLMTLTERDHLWDWLLARGITTVLFVVNFLNLMEAEQRQQVMQRLQVLAQDFRTTLPDGMNNLYAVDALPALRARLKGNMAAATGLPALETALQDLARVRLPQLALYRVPRLIPLVEQLQQILQQQLQTLTESPTSRRTLIQQQVQQLIQTGFRQSVTELEDWLQPENLLKHYQSSLAADFQTDTGTRWLEKIFKPVWKQKQRAVVAWVYKACEIFEQPRPVDLWVNWQPLPKQAPQLGDDTVSIASDYLTRFSKTASVALDEYQKKAQPILHRPIAPLSTQKYRTGQQTLLENMLIELQQLQEELQSLGP